MKNLAVILSFGLITSSMALAQQVVLGEVQLSGTGCPAGTVSVTLSPDSSVASILFSSFQVSKDQPDPLYKVLQKSCRIVLPIQVPANFALQAWKVDYRGFVHIEDPMVTFAFTSQPQLTAFQHWAFPPQTVYYKGVRDQEVSFSQNMRALSGCGSKLNLQVDMNLVVSSYQGVHPQPIRGMAMATIDSADESIADVGSGHGVHFRFALAPCH